MSTCKDCIYYDMCWQRIEIDNGNFMLGSIGNCNKFKEKSRFIELPCKVGDTVYVLDDIVDFDKCENCDHYYIGGMGDYSACNRTRYGYRYPKCIEIKTYKMTKEYIYEHLARDAFGKTVFLTEEEAEAKLKELKNE